MNASQACGVCCCISFLTLFLMIVSSFNSLDINELGLNYSSITKTVSKNSYSAGFYFLGLGHSFIKYPKTVQQFEFSKDKHADFAQLHSRTSDGLEVQLEISFQYRLQPDKIYNVFTNYKDEYKKVYMNMAIDILTNNATQYGAYQFFVDRQQIGTSMQLELNQFFSKNCFATIEFFQLRSVDLPDKFEESIQMTEVYKQSINKAEAEKEKVQVELQTLIKQAAFQKDVTVNVAQGDAIEVTKQAEAKSSSFLVRQNTNAKSYSALKKKLEMKDAELTEYIKEKVVRDYSGEDIIINIGEINNKSLDINNHVQE